MSTTHKTTLLSNESKATKESFLKTIYKTGWLQGIKDELKKVSWTSKDELKKSTKIVLASTFFVGLGIYCVDLTIRQCLEGFHVLARFIFGA